MIRISIFQRWPHDSDTHDMKLHISSWLRITSLLLWSISSVCRTIAQGNSAEAATLAPSRVLYGVSYYPEYMPHDRLHQDVSLMQKAGINVVRMGESTWSLWEPEDGRYQFARMDRVIEAMHRAGISVILGTPTYSIPPWLYKEYPEILARPLGGGPVFYGGRQNIDFDNPVFRRYARRIITQIVRHYRDNPAVIGWQVDNETSSNGASNPDVFAGFRRHLEEKFVTPEGLNRAWLLAYWGQTISRWSDLPTRDSAQNTGYKLEWQRWQQERVTRYLAWQATLVRTLRAPNQFITQDFAGAMHRDVDEFAVAKTLDVSSTNPYFSAEQHMDGEPQALIGDYIRSTKGNNYFVTETNAQTMDWTSAWLSPPYDGQIRLNVYANLAEGADMVAFWHWHSIHANQETYWKGVLGHDLQPGRTYSEVARTGQELARVGADLLHLQVHNEVAILYSVDSANALDFMPFSHGGPQWSPSTPPADYGTLVAQLHRALSQLNVGVDFVVPQTSDLSRYRVLIVPALYVSDDKLLQRISGFVANGGHVLMTFKTGFCDTNSSVRPVVMPGLLHDAVGFTYTEFSNLEKPLTLAGDPFHVGSENRVSYWAEFLKLDHAQALGYYEDSFLGRWPAVTRNSFGHGTLTYEGTFLSDSLQLAVMRNTLEIAGISLQDAGLPSSIRVHHGVANGHALHYYLNFSDVPQEAPYKYAAGTELLHGTPISRDATLQIGPWDLAIVREDGPASVNGMVTAPR